MDLVKHLTRRLPLISLVRAQTAVVAHFAALLNVYIHCMYNTCTFDELCLLVETHQPDIVETWLDHNISDNGTHLSGFQLYSTGLATTYFSTLQKVSLC